MKRRLLVFAVLVVLLFAGLEVWQHTQTTFQFAVDGKTIIDLHPPDAVKFMRDHGASETLGYVWVVDAIIFTLLLTLDAKFIHSTLLLRDNPNRDIKISFRRFLGLFITITILGALYFLVVNSWTQPERIERQPGSSIAITKSQGRLLLPVDSRVGAESSSLLRLVNPDGAVIFETQQQSVPRLGWAIQEPYWKNEVALIPADTYEIQFSDDVENTYSVIEIYDAEYVLYFKSYQEIFYMALSMAIFWFVFSFMASGLWFNVYGFNDP